MENLYELTEFKPVGKNNKKTQIILSDTKRDCKNYIQSKTNRNCRKKSKYRLSRYVTW